MIKPYRYVLIGVFLLAAGSAALGRTWTDAQGKQMDAKFVRVFNGRVVLLRAGKTMQVPFSQFSAEDQQYIREQLEAKGQGHLLPPVRNTTPALKPVTPGTAEGASSDAAPPRTWTDSLGRQIEAQFIRMSGDKVVLLKDGKSTSFPFAQFSAEDQEYVRQQLEAKGQGHLLPGAGGQNRAVGGPAAGTTHPPNRTPARPAPPVRTPPPRPHVSRAPGYSPPSQTYSRPRTQPPGVTGHRPSIPDPRTYEPRYTPPPMPKIPGDPSPSGGYGLPPRSLPGGSSDYIASPPPTKGKGSAAYRIGQFSGLAGLIGLIVGFLYRFLRSD